jgi:hypothetical protein
VKERLLRVSLAAGLAAGMMAVSEAAAFAQAATAAAPAAAAGQRGQGGQAAAPAIPPPPAPRWPDGKIRLSAVPGEKGLWTGGGGGQAQIPYQPWAAAMAEFRIREQLDPHTRCHPGGGPRQFLTPYGVEIVDVPELNRIYILDVGGPHTFRIIYTDGRSHPKDLVPSHYGHSIGHWEGDTLVVDTIGFHEKMWIDRGQAPHTEKLHLIEKFTRTDMNTMRYELTIDDPHAYTATWSRSSTMTFRPDRELFEFICQDNNYAPELLVGTGESVDRSSPIVP